MKFVNVVLSPEKQAIFNTMVEVTNGQAVPLSDLLKHKNIRHIRGFNLITDEMKQQGLISISRKGFEVIAIPAKVVVKNIDNQTNNSDMKKEPKTQTKPVNKTVNKKAAATTIGDVIHPDIKEKIAAVPPVIIDPIEAEILEIILYNEFNDSNAFDYPVFRNVVEDFSPVKGKKFHAILQGMALKGLIKIEGVKTETALLANSAHDDTITKAVDEVIRIKLEAEKAAKAKAAAAAPVKPAAPAKDKAPKAAAATPAKKINRLDSVGIVIRGAVKDLEKGVEVIISMDTLVKESNDVYLANGGKDNIKEAKWASNLAVNTLAAVGLAERVDADTVTIQAF